MVLPLFLLLERPLVGGGGKGGGGEGGSGGEDWWGSDEEFMCEVFGCVGELLHSRVNQQDFWRFLFRYLYMHLRYLFYLDISM